MSVWGSRAERLLEQALGEVLSSIDAIPTVDAALAALRIEAGELPADELDGYPFPGEESDKDCTCPPDLRERGGFTSTCPAHGSAPPYPGFPERYPSGADSVLTEDGSLPDVAQPARILTDEEHANLPARDERSIADQLTKGAERG